ncbi:hypothetical protein Moror_14575 [Moniliophthora roreri MCA 2997]|nr:hypothetical protein Moror_14575 [Moniliophthora roreri MCA 2997]
MGGNATPEMTAPSRRLHEKLKEMDTFAGTIGKYGSLTLSFIWRRGETAKIKEYEAFIHDIFLDDDLLPKLERKPLRVTTNLGSAGASPQPYQSTTFARSPWSPSNRESLAFYPSPQVSPLSGFHPNSSSPTITTPSTQTKFNSMAFWARSVKEFIYATDYRKSETHLHIHVDGSSNTQTNINMNSCNQKYFFPDVEGRTVYDDYEP